MNKLKIIRGTSLLLGTVLFGTTSLAIIIRHDVAPEDYEIQATDFPAVFYLERQGNSPVCAATLIHPRWAITAAHCAGETTLANTLENGLEFSVRVGGEVRNIDGLIIHPQFDLEAETDVDLALLRFASAVANPLPMPLHTASDEADTIVSLIGWGFFGVGTTGRQYSDGVMRRATNRISDVGQRLHIRFGDPRDNTTDTLPLEGMPGLWDSGGPALIPGDSGYSLAGVAVGEIEGADFSEETQGKYGSEAVYERISSHIQWIETVIGSEYPFDS